MTQKTQTQTKTRTNTQTPNTDPAANREIFAALEAHLRPVFEQSTEGVYVWLDGENKACNERLARLFGMSPAAWRSRGDFLSSFVAEEDRERFSRNYHHHVAALRHPVTFRFRALRGDGTTFEAETDMIPLSYAGRAVAYHFVREVSA